MRAARGVGLVLALGLGACRSSSGEAADAGLPVVSSALRCETLLPADVRAFALPGFILQEERPCPTCGPLCALSSAAEPEVRVSLAYDCQERFLAVETETLLAPTLKAGGLQISAMGRAAARRAPVPGMLQVVAWDDDTPCAVIVTWLGGDTERAVDITRTALHATTPASVTGTPATLADLHLPPPPVDPSPTAPPDVAGLLAPADAGTPAPPRPVPPVNARPPAPAVNPPRPAAPSPAPAVNPAPAARPAAAPLAAQPPAQPGAAPPAAQPKPPAAPPSAAQPPAPVAAPADAGTPAPP